MTIAGQIERETNLLVFQLEEYLRLLTSLAAAKGVMLDVAGRTESYARLVGGRELKMAEQLVADEPLQRHPVGTVDHLAQQRKSGRRRVVEPDADHHPGRGQLHVPAGGLGRGLDLVQLAAADQGGGIGAIDARGERGGHAGAGRTRQVGEFLQHVLGHGPTGVGLDQQRVFTLAGTFEQTGLREATAPSTCPVAVRGHSASSPPSSGSPGCCT